MISVDEIYVGVATREKKRFVAESKPTEGVRGSIAYQVGFSFDNSSAEAALRNFVYERLADQEFCEFDGIDGKLAQAKAANPARD